MIFTLSDTAKTHKKKRIAWSFEVFILELGAKILNNQHLFNTLKNRMKLKKRSLIDAVYISIALLSLLNHFFKINLLLRKKKIINEIVF